MKNIVGKGKSRQKGGVAGPGDARQRGKQPSMGEQREGVVTGKNRETGGVFFRRRKQDPKRA